MDGDPGHILEIIQASESLEEAASKLGSTVEYLRSVQERFESEEDTVDTQEFPLAAGEAIPVQTLPTWLTKPLPKDAKKRTRWPGGAKSPSWFKMISGCPRKHAQRYRYKRPDPSGLDAIMGNALHGTFQESALLRLHKRKGAPMNAGKDELLYLLERQPEVVHDRGTEVLKRCRLVIGDMEDPLKLDNVWAAEFLWSFHASAGLLIAGIADLILVFYDPNNPQGPPELVVVVDYKTGPGHVPDKEELSSDVQACLELIWARRYFHSAKRVQFRLWNVAQNQKVTIDWNHEIERTTLAFVRACFHMWVNKIETANVTRSCKWCPYRTDCKAFSQDLQREAYRAKESLEHKDIGELIEIHHRAKVTADIAETRKKDAAALILEKMGPLQRTYRSQRLLALKKTRKNESFSSVSDTLFKLGELTGINLGSLLDSCVTIGPKKLKTWVNTLPEDKQEITKKLIESMIQRRSSPPWVETRASNSGF